MSSEYIKRDFEGQSIEYNNNDYYRVEIESYDPSNIINKNHESSWKGTNFKKVSEEGSFTTISAINKKSNVNILTNHNITEPGTYRIHIKGYSTTSNENIELKINDKTINKIKSTSEDICYKTWDLGLINLNTGDNSFNVIFGGNTQIIAVYILKIRKTSGDNNNNGELTLIDSQTTLQSSGEMQELSLTIMNSDKDYENGGFMELGNTTGVIFEYRDSINFFIKNIFGEESQIFGGYISSAIVSEDKLTIDIKAVNRLKDYDKEFMIKELNIGKAITTQAQTKNCDTLYEALKYISNNIELPASPVNIDNLKNEIVYKTGYQQNLGNSKEQNYIAVSKIIKFNKTKNFITLRNGSAFNQTQMAIIKKGLSINLKNYPVFFINYGMGAPLTSKKEFQGYKANGKIVKPTKNQIKKGKIKVITKVKGKKKTKTKTYNLKKWEETVKRGFDIDKPFLAWIEIQFSLTPNGIVKKANINFTANTTNYQIGSITPILANNKQSRGEINLYNVLKTMYPNNNDFYLKQVSFVGKTPIKQSGSTEKVLYDKYDLSVYLMNFYNWGVRSGYDAVVPTIMTSSGKSYLDLMNDVCAELKISPQLIYANERRLDKLNFDKDNDEVAILELKEGIDGNIYSIESLTYTPVSKLKNKVIKIYKNTNGNYEYVKEEDTDNILRYGVHEDIEVLNDEVGSFHARYLAKTDVDKTSELDFTYSLDVKGHLDLKIGQFVQCVFNNNIYDDIKQVKSLSIATDTKEAIEVMTTVGLDEINPLILAKLNIDKLKKLTNDKRTIFSGGAIKVVD